MRPMNFLLQSCSGSGEEEAFAFLENAAVKTHTGCMGWLLQDPEKQIGVGRLNKETGFQMLLSYHVGFRAACNPEVGNDSGEWAVV